MEHQRTTTSELKNDVNHILTIQARKKNFVLRIFLVNVTEYEVSCGSDHIYWRNP